MPDDPRAELIEALRAILAAPGTSGKALEAKASAARQLAHLQGFARTAHEPDPAVPEAVDLMADLDEPEARRRKRSTGVR